MKKIVSLLIAVMMLSTVAFGAANISGATTEYKTLTVNYSGLTSDQATIVVYQIGDEAGTPEFDAEKHSIVGVNQDTTGSSFEIRLGNPDYTGALVAAVGGDGTVARYRIEVVGGVPSKITAPIDCEDGTITLDGEEILEIGHLKLSKAYVSNVSGGTITYINKTGDSIDLKGSMYFNAAGDISSAAEKVPVMLTKETGANEKAVGFIWEDKNVTEGSYVYKVSSGSNEMSGEFDIAEGLSGHFKFAVGVEKVPADINLELIILGN